MVMRKIVILNMGLLLLVKKKTHNICSGSFRNSSQHEATYDFVVMQTYANIVEVALVM